MRKHCGIVLALLFSSSLVAATEQADTQVIIERTGLLGLSTQAQILTQQAVQESKIAHEKHAEIIQQVAKRWSVASLNQRLQTELKKLTSSQQQQLVQLINDPYLIKAGSREQLAIEQQPSIAYQAYRKKLQEQPPTEQRLQKIQTLNQAMRFSALLIKARQSISVDITKLMPHWQQDGQWEKQLEQQALEYLLYTYRTMPNKELEQVIQLYQQPVLQQWLMQVEQSL